VPVKDDAQLTAGLLAKSNAGFIDVYAVYAARLYDYAVGMVRDPVAAEDAVLDALLVAVDRADRLRDPMQLGVWLYALTRNECLRQLRRSGTAQALQSADEEEPTAFFTGDGAPSQAQGWARSAAATLDPQNREALDLGLRHALTQAQLAVVLGLSARRTAALVATSRAQLSRAFEATRLTNGAGHGACVELSALLSGWNGVITKSARDLIDLHKATCLACVTESRGGFDAAKQFAQLPPHPLPDHLQSHVRRAATVPSRVSARGEIAEPFFRSGFPVPLDRAGRRAGRVWVAVAGAAAVVALLVSVLLVVTRPAPGERIGGGPGAGPGIAIPATSRQSLPPPTPLPARRVSPTPSATKPSKPAPPVPTARPTPSKARPPNPTPRPSQTRPSGGRPAIQIDALFADATVGCPSRWRGTATAFIRFTTPRQVTFFWGTNSNPSRRVPMRKVNDGIYQANVNGLPLGRTVFWKVSAVIADGRTAVTGVSTVKRDRCR
jgi:RNA polymerase sigma factor (sigma-70 family)